LVMRLRQHGAEEQLVDEIGVALHGIKNCPHPAGRASPDVRLEQIYLIATASMNLAAFRHYLLAERATRVAADLLEALPSDVDIWGRHHAALQLATAWATLGKVKESYKLADTYQVQEWRRSPIYKAYAYYSAQKNHFAEALRYARKNFGLGEERTEWLARLCNRDLLMYIAVQCARAGRQTEAFALLVLLWRQVQSHILPRYVLPELIKPMFQAGFKREADEILREVLALHKPPYEDEDAARFVIGIFYHIEDTGLAYEEEPPPAPPDA